MTNKDIETIKENGFEYIEEHKGDTNYGMMLHFNTEPYTRPIKNHKVKDYEQILGL